ncbi:MAG TPA: extracellular solute-binding protein [Verrucomicrobiaceae bacterium]
MKRTLPAALALAAIMLLPTCGGKKESSAQDVTAEVQKFYKEAKNRNGGQVFFFKSMADLPADLKWEDGAEQEEFGAPEAKKGGTYHYFIQDYPRTLRHVGPDANSNTREYLLDYFYLTMLGRHPNTLEPIPSIAKQWARGPDKKTFYFRIDPDAKFSDGEPVRVDNFFFNIFFMRSDYLKDPWYPDQYTKRIDSVTKYDDLTISITMADAKPDALYHAGSLLTPLPIKFFKEFGEDYVERYNWRFVPSPGPYDLKESGLKKGQSVTLTRIKDWWAKDRKFYRQQFNPDRIVLEVIRDPEKAIEMFRAGDLDCYLLNLPERWHSKIPDNDPLVEKGYLHKYTFFNQVPRPTYGLYINTSRPLLDNHEIREGLQYSCDWDAVIKQVFYGDYTRLNIAEEGFGEFTDTSIKARPFDPVQAAEFFAKAGFTERGGDGIFKNAKGERLSFTITNSYKVLEPALVVIKEEAKKAGVEFNIETPEVTASWKKFNERKHDIAFTAFNVSVEMYPRFWEDWHSINAYKKDGSIQPDTNNFTMMNDKELDAWIDRYDRSEDKAEMKDLAWKIERRVHDSAAFIPGFESPWYRVGCWRWVHHPATFDARTARDPEENWLFWINEDERQETKDAMQSGKTFPKEVKSIERWKEK